MPGTPIIYYGDEIAMGDNVYLGDRNGVRTPMQWSSDRNAGFSRADQDIVLCVANLSRAVQPVEIPLAPFAGLTPVEMLGETEFPRIGPDPYFLALAPYGFYWFQLQPVVTPLSAAS